jgi:hypothetical protein
MTQGPLDGPERLKALAIIGAVIVVIVLVTGSTDSVLPILALLLVVLGLQSQRPRDDE